MNNAFKNNQIVLITKYFPFNKGEVPAESYLESEIWILASMFKEVYVFAVDAPRGRQLCQNMPKDVVAIPLGIAKDRYAKMRLAFTSLLPVRQQSRKLYKHIRKSDQSIDSIARLVGFRYLFNKAEAYRIAIVDAVKQKGLHLDGSIFYSFWLFDTALTALELSAFFKGKSLSRAHRYDLYENQNQLGYLPFRRYLGDNLDYVAPCSKDGVRHLINTEEYDPNKVKLSYLGTDDLGFKCLECVGRNPLVVSCSTLTVIKRVPLIAEAMGILDEEGFRLRWRHYGSGPEMGIVQDAIKNFKYIDAKLLGYVEHEAMLNAYRSEPPSLFINSSSSEGVPISIMEACSLGTPIVCTDVGGSAEIVSDQNGILLESNPTPQDIADAIRRVLTVDDNMYRGLREASRRVWEAKFNASTNVKLLFTGMMKGNTNG